jgi:hypothetical protein
MASIQALTTKETTSKAHMQVHTNGESHKKQPGRKPRPNWAEMGPGRSAQPIPGSVRHPFDLATIWPIYIPLAKSHELIHSSSSAEEQRREGQHSGEERVEMVD